jgi:hypothetical protein
MCPLRRGHTFSMEWREVSFSLSIPKPFMLNSLTVTERLFSILLQAFISILNAVIEKSKKHEIIGGVSIHFITCYS